MMHRLLALSALIASPAAGALRDAVDLVDPFMGTAGDRGQLSPSAAAPFGMIQLGPDTDPANHQGYERGASSVRGFSQTRAQGVGCHGGGGDLLTSVTYAGDPAVSPLDRRSERAGAGWYHVRYGRTPISADFAAGQSVSISRFTASRAGVMMVRIDPRYSYAKHIEHEWESSVPADLRLRLANATVCGKGVYRLAIAAQLSLKGHPVQQAGTLDRDGVLQVELRVQKGDRIELRVAVSTVDPASAKATMQRELGALTLEQLRTRTRRDWQARLSRVEFKAAPDRRALFYTCLFRALQWPARIDDSVGTYRGSDGKVRQVQAGHHRYSGWSLWDNYRTQMPLVALVAPDIGGDVADSLVELFLAGKPQWAGPTEPFLSVRTEHAGIALLDLYRKGFGQIDPVAALPAMVEETARLPQATPDERLELAYDQWAVAELASDRGQAQLARTFAMRALEYRTLWNDVFRNLGPDADTVKARGLYQGTLWQYRWAPVFDLDWIRNEALGNTRFAVELSQFFNQNLFNMTNEPDIHAPFLFALAEDPVRMDQLIARLRDEPIDHWYENQGKYDRPFHQRSFSQLGFAEGMDDDGGAMSAWYVWASLGLYPLVPGKPFYLLSRPAQASIRLHLASGHSMTITQDVHREAMNAPSLNGGALPQRSLRHEQLLDGGRIAW
jgi:putative alpha-1,2-mannosidase